MTQLISGLESIRSLPNRINSASLRERKLLFNDLHKVLIEENRGSNEATLGPLIRKVCDLLTSTLVRYQDRKSRLLVLNLLQSLIATHPDSSSKGMVKSLVNYFKDIRNIQTNFASARICLSAFQWTTLLTGSTLSAMDQEMRVNLIDLQGFLVFVISGSSNQSLQVQTVKLLKQFWTTSYPIEEYALELSKMEVTPSSSIYLFVLWGYIFQILSQNKRNDLITTYKVTIIDFFLKHIAVSKTKLPVDALTQGGSQVLRQINHDEFKTKLLPGLQRSVLRNPEISLELVTKLIKNVSLDLSPYAAELGKMIGVSLISKEEDLIKIAITGSTNLAHQCSDPTAIETLLKLYFGILNGSEGKLTVITQRYGALSGIGSLSCHSVQPGPSSVSLSEHACQQFLTFLKTEVHEGTIIHGCSQMQLWCSRITVGQMPSPLMVRVKEIANSKNVQPFVKSAYFACLYAAFNDENVNQVIGLLDLLTASATKAFNASVTQLPLVTEGLYAAVVIVKAFCLDKQLETKHKSTMNGLLDLSKLPFLLGKFVNQSSPPAQLMLISFIERMCLNYEAKIKDKINFLTTPLIHLMITPNSYEVRKQAIKTCRNLLNNLCETEFFPSLMTSFKEIFEKYERPTISTKEEPETNAVPTERTINIPALINCILTSSLIAGKVSESQVSKTLVSAFNASHVPVLFESEPKLWITLVKKLADPSKVESLIISIAGDLCESIFKEKQNVTLQCNCIKTLVCYFPDQFMDRILTKIGQILDNPDLKTITVEEFEIFKYPEGELWDKSVVEALKEETQTKNIKRENKLYSYKEQLADLEIRKEIDAKRKKQNPNTEEPLNEKQIIAKKAQLEKESTIRSRLKSLYDDLTIAVHFLNSLVEGNKMQTAFRVSKVIPLLTNLLESPLCSELISDTFISLSDCSFLYNNSPFGFDKRIGYTILRVLKPFHPIDEKWLKEDVTSSTEQIINFIHQKTCPPQTREKYDKRLASIAYTKFTAPAFAYCFPLFGYLINCDEKDPDLIEKCLEIIIEHSKIRFEEPTIDEFDQIDESAFLKNPQYLPRYQALQTLYSFLEEPIPYLEPLIMSAIKSIAEASNGAEGFAKPMKEELLLYLDKLKKELDCIRDVSLDSLILIADFLRSFKDPKFRAILRHRSWIVRFDPVEEIVGKAQLLWDRIEIQPSPALCTAVIEDLNVAGPNLRESVSSAMDGLLTIYPNEVKATVHKLMNYYKERAKPPPPVKDPYNRTNQESQVDFYEPRLGAALCLTKIAGHLNDQLVMETANFLIPLALGDRNVHVQSQMLEVGISIADKHGKRCMTQLLQILRKYLDKAQDNSQNGIVKRSVVILMGTLARHLETDDAKVKPIVVKLIETLSTPSELVQEAVANCLPPLIPAFKDEAPLIVQKLLQLLLDSDKHGERRGAAHGIAGIVKGLGILSLRQLGIMETLTEAITSKKNANHREGALFAFERLCVMLGRLFEPYIIHILPNLLLCFGDASTKVRKATDDTAKAFMIKLSAHGVKLVLPSLLDALEQDSWRTKTGSIELLGAMAFCAPKQLSSCLPSIVPKLMTVLSDSHPKVQQAGEQALKQIGSVIRNPEIQSIVPILLEALQDPANKTPKCLTTMLSTKFVHFIDAPSLALIMPVTERAFQGRSTETRKMAAQIIGNMYSLTDQKDLSPYLPSIIPGLKQSLLDPVPEVRAVTARALGAMVKGMGEDVLDQLMPWLMATLTSDGSSVDRSGAAQGLAEVMGGLGLEKLELLMPEIISMSERNDIPSHTKDGYIMLFIYLPMVFTQDFIPYIDKIINPVLKALADESEFVRETALKAGQRIVNMYADTAIQLLLPQLEQGLFDENWRIRYSSVQLLGDLLYKISGVSGKMTTETADEDDNFGTEQSYKAIISCLGTERRNRVISGLYMGRCDVSPNVRQAALHVWKVIVSNTPKTLKEIMPTLFLLLLGCLASNSYDKQKIAARTLGDLVKKLGERVLPEIIPILEQGLESDRADQRQGVCIGLSEIMSSTSREMVQAFVDSLVPTVTKALYDPLPEVRQAAAKTFDSLHAAVGARALDEILPPLLNQLGDPVVGEYTLDGLRQVMAIKSRVVLPYLVPQLTVPPVNTRALSLLATVAGDSLSKHLGKILPALLLSLSKSLDTPHEKQELEYCQSVILSVVDETGTRTIVDNLLESARNESPAVRRAAVRLLSVYCHQTKAAFSSLVPQLIRGLILLFTDSNEQVLLLSWEAFASVTKSLDSKEQIECLGEVRHAVRHAAGDLKGSTLLPGFCLDKGISPILPIFREAILNGNPEQKEQAADGLSEVIQLTSPDALKSSVVNIAGPLIRILGDRYSWNVKVSVLDTLSLLLGKAGSFLRPFIPQLQQTFLKSLVDSNRIVRLRAANAMSHLIAIHPRCDMVFTEVHNSIKGMTGGDDQVQRETMLYALRLGILKAGSKISETNRLAIASTATSLLDNINDSVRNAAASCLGTLCKCLSNDELENIARDHLLEDEPSSYWNRRHGQSIALRVALKEAPERLLCNPDWEEKIIKHILAQIGADRIPVVCSGVKSCAYVFAYKIPKDEPLPQQLVSSFARCMNHANNEVKQTVANSSIFMTKNLPCPFPLTFLKTLVPLLVMGTKEKNSAVRSNSEQALVTVLKLRTGDECAKQIVNALDRGPKEVLQECISKTLKKVINQPEPKEEQFDDTLLT